MIVFGRVRYVILGSLAILLFFSIVQPVSASGQQVDTTVTFSISGSQPLSDYFNMTLGEQLNFTYTISSASNSTCAEVTGSYDRNIGATRPAPYNQTFPPSKLNSTYSHTFPTAQGTESLVITYETCPGTPQCQGEATFKVKYEMQLAALPPVGPPSPISQYDIAVFVVVVISVVALVATYVIQKGWPSRAMRSA